MAPPKRQRRTQALDNLGAPIDGYVLTGDADSEFGVGWEDPALTTEEVQALAKSPVPLFVRGADGSSVSVDGTEDDLVSDTLAAGLLAADGDRVEWEVAVTYASHATATRRHKLYACGTVISDTTTPTAYSAGVSVVHEVSLVRVSASVVRYRVQTSGTNLATGASLGSGLVGEITGLTLADTQVLKVGAIAAGTGAAAGDIRHRSSDATFWPAP